MSTESLYPNIYLSNVDFNLTTRCNFACIHCAKGEAGKKDMSLEDLGLVLPKVINPDLESITITGGQATLHPQFEQVGPLIRKAVKAAGGGMAADTPISYRDRIKQGYELQVARHINKLPIEQELRLTRTGELAAMMDQAFRSFGHSEYRFLRLELYTNGTGMEDPAKTSAILYDYNKQGYGSVEVSLDKPHLAQGRRIDYVFLQAVTENPQYQKSLREQGIIPAGLDVGYLGIRAYAIPIGRAARLSKRDRFMLADPDQAQQQITMSNMEARLRKEFKNWGSIFGDYEVWYDVNENREYPTHCYCNTAVFYRMAEASLNYAPENRSMMSKLDVDVDFSARLCLLDALPALGNLRTDTVWDIYERALNSKLIEIIGHEGPQGVAKRLTSLSEDKLRKMYTDLCPCGMCDYLMKEYPKRMLELAHAPSSYKKLAEKAARKRP